MVALKGARVLGLWRRIFLLLASREKGFTWKVVGCRVVEGRQRFFAFSRCLALAFFNSIWDYKCFVSLFFFFFWLTL